MPQQLTAWHDSLLFMADDGNGGQLWLTDGSTAGTVRLTRRVGQPSNECEGYVCGFGLDDDQFLYVGTDPAHGPEPWVYRRPPR